VAEHIAMALQYGELPAREHAKRIAEAMKRPGISHRASHRPHQLSLHGDDVMAILRVEPRGHDPGDGRPIAAARGVGIAHLAAAGWSDAGGCAGGGSP